MIVFTTFQKEHRFMNSSFEITFLGTGGSCGYNNGKREKYGTNTPCVAVNVGGHTLVFDAGNGICGLSALPEYNNEKIHLFFTHYHSDHIRGFLFWDMIFNAKKNIHITGMRSERGGVHKTMDGYLTGPYYPAGLNYVKAALTFTDAEADAVYNLGNGVTVHTVALSHPNGGLGYRVNYNGKSMCYLSDMALENHRDKNSLADFARDADLLITDAFFGVGECIPGWGHSSVRECVQLAKEADAKRLSLFHYKHTATDSDIDEMEAVAKVGFPNAFAPADGFCMTI
jgi:phosphoribosyl 1,2-cyclic phosphodiesterase